MPTLLIVDDNPVDRRLVKRFLDQDDTDYTLIEAKTATDGLELARTRAIDCALIDFRMPDMSGLELLSSLRALDNGPQVVMLTGSGSETIAVKAMKAGAADYLMKETLNGPAVRRAVRTALKIRRAERVLQESERRFTSLADAAPVLIWMADAEAEAEFVNQGWLDYTGTTLEAALGQGWLSCFHPEDLEAFLETYRQAVQTGASFSGEYRVAHVQDDHRWIAIETRVRNTIEGDFAGFTGSCVDITEQKRASAENEQRYLAVFNAQLTALVSTDESGFVTSYNETASRLLGYGPKELNGQHAGVLLGRGLTYASLMVDLDGNPLVHLNEANFVRKSGEAFPAEVVLSKLQVGDAVVGYSYLIRDTSLEKQTEAKLADTNQRLLHSRDEERRRLARDLHDGTVQDLVGLSFNLARLEREVAENRVSQDDLLAQVGAWRGGITDLIRQLRAIISDLRPAGLEEFGLVSVLEGYLETLKRNTHSELPVLHLQVEGELDDLPLPLALCLFRTVQESLSNVIKHAEASRATLQLCQTEGEVSLQIKDDGLGFVPPDNLDDFALEQHFGLIGLTERADLMGGRSRVSSSPGNGTEITVVLPLNPNAQTDPV